MGKAAAPQSGVWAQIVHSVLTPGVTPFLEVATHVVFAALFVVVGATAFTAEEGRVHLLALLGLALCLYVCLVWFIKELHAVKSGAVKATKGADSKKTK
eukprot:m51a1_g5201 putative pkr1p (99) ;mRNA; r:213854-214368